MPMQRANRLINIRITAGIQVNILITTMERQGMSIRIWLNIIKTKPRKLPIRMPWTMELKILPVMMAITAMNLMIMSVLIIQIGAVL